MGYPVPGENKYRNLALQVGGVSQIETIKYAHESRGTQISRQRGRLTTNRKLSKNIIKDRMGKIGRGSQMGV
jgi:hypothetical protein